MCMFLKSTEVMCTCRRDTSLRVSDCESTYSKEVGTSDTQDLLIEALMLMCRPRTKGDGDVGSGLFEANGRTGFGFQVAVGARWTKRGRRLSIHQGAVYLLALL